MSETKTHCARPGGRTESPIDTRWRFHLGESPRALDPELDDGDWQEVRLPHDWAIEQPTDYHMPQAHQQGFQRRAHVGWYRRRLELVPEAGTRYRLRLDGAYRHAELWVNGVSFGRRPSGYATRIHDVTDALRVDGRQLVAVRCDNTAHDGDRWYAGAGLYRRVFLTATGDVAVAPWGVAITTPELGAEAARVELRVRVESHRGRPTTARVGGELRDGDGAVCAALDPQEVALPAGGSAEAVLSATLRHPALWSPESPALYEALVTVDAAGARRDALATPFGVRRFAFDPDGGLVLNGESRTMKGICLHHDLGCLGTASFADAWERRLRRLKELGGDAIRTSHNPPDPALLDLCDRLGVMVIDEAFDGWRKGASLGHFDEWWQADLEAMVLRDRNHPSVLVWSVGNEVEEQGSERMLATCKMLADHVKRLDPTRPTMVALRPFENDAELWRAPVSRKVGIVQRVAETVDLVGLNYQDQWYDAMREAMPDRVFLATEAFHFFYHKTNGSWAMHAENPWLRVAESPHVAGQFLWTGIEYLGETHRHRWPSRGWRAAPIDTAGFAKPRAWWHGAAWRAEPTVAVAVRHRTEETLEPFDWVFPPLADHWNLPWREGEPVEVWVFANTHGVTLYLGDEPMGDCRVAEQPNGIGVFYLPYRQGSVTAVGYDEAGEAVARHALETVGPVAGARVSPDRETLAPNDQDLAHLAIELVDAAGRRVPGADHPIGVEVQGPAHLMGMDNGDLRCHTPFPSNRRPAHDGRCLAVVRAGHTPGPVTVTAVAEQLPPAARTLHVRP